MVAYLRRHAAKIASLPSGGLKIDFGGPDISYTWTEVERERLDDGKQRLSA